MTGRGLPTLRLVDPACEIRLRSNQRARRFTLRLETGTGNAILTVPAAASRAEAEAFLARHADWLRTALARQPAVVTVDHGTVLPIDGRPVRVEVMTGPRRSPVLEAERLLLQGTGPAGPRIAAFLKLRARDRLLPTARGYARRLGRRVAAISLRDTRSRWGSCSSTGRLSFSWRLAMAPPDVQDYVAAHEAAHLAEMNHSARYWAVLAGLMPDYEARRDWLKREGRGLHAYRFG